METDQKYARNMIRKMYHEMSTADLARLSPDQRELVDQIVLNGPIEYTDEDKQIIAQSEAIGRAEDYGIVSGREPMRDRVRWFFRRLLRFWRGAK